MAIGDIRFDFTASTPAISRSLNLSVYGVASWFDERLKGRKRRFLGGPEVKGLSIVNLSFTNQPDMHDEEMFGALTYYFPFDEGLFVNREWVENLRAMFGMARERLSVVIYPQLRWFAQELLVDPSEAELVRISLHIKNWQAYCDGQ